MALRSLSYVDCLKHSRYVLLMFLRQVLRREDDVRVMCQGILLSDDSVADPEIC